MLAARAPEDLAQAEQRHWMLGRWDESGPSGFVPGPIYAGNENTVSRSGLSPGPQYRLRAYGTGES